MAKFKLSSFRKDRQAVAAVVPVDDLFGRLTRRIELPADIAAAVTRPEGDVTLVPAGGEIDRSQVSSVLLFRTTPVELELTYSDLSSADSYQCTAVVRVQVAVAPELSELQSFRKTVLGTVDQADVDALAKQLRWQIQHALAKFAAGSKAAELLDAPQVAELQAVIREQTQPACFAAGLKLVEPMEAAFDCPAYQKVRRTAEQTARQRDQLAARRQLAQAIHQTQQQHLAELDELLGQLQSIAETSPELSLPELVKTFSQDRRAQLYQALAALLPPTEKTQWMVFVAGGELLWFEPPAAKLAADQSPEPARRITITDRLGPLRCVRTGTDSGGRSLLLVGAQQGVHLLDQNTLHVVNSFSFSRPGELRGGVNAAALVGETLLASHSEAGLLAWSGDQPDQPRQLLTDLTAGARAVRHVQNDESGHVWLAIDQKVLRLPADKLDEQPTVFSGCDDVVSALAVADQHVYATTHNGQLLRWSVDQESQPQLLVPPTGKPIESLQVLAIGQILRMVYPDASHQLSARVLGDMYICQYRADQPLRFGRAAADLLLAINDRRDRAYLFAPHEPAEPLATFHIGRLTGHTIQDATLLPGRQTS